MIATGPTTPTVTASIGVAPTPYVPLNLTCAGSPWSAPMWDLVIVTSRSVDLDSVTMQMIDGTHLGGPMITFPRADLTTQFGTTRILAGTSRRFALRHQFPCDVSRPRSLAAQVALVDLDGRTHGVTVTSPWP
jgi:hypothetical protein